MKKLYIILILLAPWQLFAQVDLQEDDEYAKVERNELDEPDGIKGTNSRYETIFDHSSFNDNPLKSYNEEDGGIFYKKKPPKVPINQHIWIIIVGGMLLSVHALYLKRKFSKKQL